MAWVLCKTCGYEKWVSGWGTTHQCGPRREPLADPEAERRFHEGRRERALQRAHIAYAAEIESLRPGKDN